ncbi:MAG: hypothetical protein WCQ95_06775 [Bacteroidota bacterium]
MDTKELKKKLVDACMVLQKKIADNAMAEIKDAYENANDYGNPEDWFDTYKMDLLNKSDIYSQQLRIALEEIKNLERINTSKSNTIVELGAIVVTNSQKLFIAIGIGKVIIDGELYYAISPSVPLFMAMKGKKAGDNYEFRGKEGTINEVI